MLSSLTLLPCGLALLLRGVALFLGGSALDFQALPSLLFHPQCLACSPRFHCFLASFLLPALASSLTTLVCHARRLLLLAEAGVTQPLPFASLDRARQDDGGVR